MGDTEPPNNMLHKAKHTNSSILSYRVGLDPIATSYLVGYKCKWSIGSIISVFATLCAILLTLNKKKVLWGLY